MDSSTPTKKSIASEFQLLQARICQGISDVDGSAVFGSDHWNREEGGGGITRILLNGSALAKAGVAFSEVSGPTPDKIKTYLNVTADHFMATGVSIVMHPANPWIPIIHMNIRLFEMSDGTWWFGGGMDLTPHYLDESQAKWFHQQLKDVCDRFDSSFYPKFKTWADDYFFIQHRNETRGIGGIFFDRLNEQSTGMSKAQLFDFVMAVGEAFEPIYTYMIVQNRAKSFGKRELTWQAVRRSRYVEYNLVYDKGTMFGLQTNGRIESILMSMPPVAEWHYLFQTAPDSLESATVRQLVKGIDWVNMG